MNYAMMSVCEECEMRVYLIPLAAFTIAKHVDKDKMHSRKRANIYTWGTAKRSIQDAEADAALSA